MGNVTQWRNQGELSRFPFRETASLTDSAGVILSDGFLVDAQIFLPSYLATPVYLASLTLTGDVVTGMIAAGDGTQFAGFTVPFKGINGAVVPLADPAGPDRGVLVFGKKASSSFLNLLNSTLSFNPDGTEFESSCIVEIPPILNGLQAGSGLACGKVALCEGAGIRLIKLSGTDIRIDAVGTPEDQAGCCNQTGTPLSGINGAVPDQYGNLRFGLEPFGVPSGPADIRQALRITPTLNGLQFSLV